MTAPGPVRLVPLCTGIVSPGDELLAVLADAWREAGEPPVKGDVLVVSSKVVALCEGRLVDLSSVKPSKEARRLAKHHGMDPAFTEVVLQEADVVLGGVKGALLTLRQGAFIANAGADLSNCPPGHTILWPADPWESASRLREGLAGVGAPGVGVVVVDSHVQPLRWGTVGMALGWAGLVGVEDERGRQDLFGRTLRITRRNVADQLASAASLLMGEADEAIPAVLVKGLDVRHPVGMGQGPADLIVDPSQCLFAPAYGPRVLGKARRGGSARSQRK
jgi:coenzyme F420-0:L-glutamate ligase